MTNKLEQAARQALEALEMHAHGAGSIIHTKLAWDALREALAEQAEQEPSCNQHPDAPHGFARNASHNAGRYVCECEGWEPEQEPVAWATFKASELSEIAKRIDADDSEGIDSWSWRMGALWAEQRLQKLNAAPVRTKDLSDDEILSIPYLGTGELKTSMVNFARTVIAADRKLNGVEK